MAIFFDEDRVELARFRVNNNTKCHHRCCEECEHILKPCRMEKADQEFIIGCEDVEKLILTLCGEATDGTN